MLGQAALAAAARWAGRTAAAGQGAPTVLRAGQQQSLAFSKAEARRMAEKNGNGGGGGGEGGGWFTVRTPAALASGQLPQRRCNVLSPTATAPARAAFAM